MSSGKTDPNGAFDGPSTGQVIRLAAYNEEGTTNENGFLAGGRGGSGAGAARFRSDTIKIGFVSTFSGPTAVIGNDMRNSFELALDHIGRKMGGKPVEVIYEDDGQKPDVGKQKTEKLISPTRSISLPAISGRTCCWLR